MLRQYNARTTPSPAVALIGIRRLIANTALLLVSACIAFLLGEVAVRVLFKDTTVLFPRYHTDYQYGRYTLRGIRPNSEFWHTSVDGSWKFVTNNKGFRSMTDYAYEKPALTTRVLALGDSHTLGSEVQQEATFSAVLERYLGWHNVNAEVINTGVTGFSTAEELAFLENEGYRYQPDVVVVGFFGNDYGDNLKARLFVLDDEGRLVENSYQHTPGVAIQNFIYSIPGVRWLSENSYFYSMLFNKVWAYFKEKLRKEAIRSVTADIEEEYVVPMTVTYADRTASLAAALLERMQRFCAERGIHFIVVDIPAQRGKFAFASSLSPLLRARLDAAGIEYIDSEVLLSDYTGSAHLHTPHGYLHISEFTHAMIGVEIGRRVLAVRQAKEHLRATLAPSGKQSTIEAARDTSTTPE
jgi:hypothetical protein